ECDFVLAVAALFPEDRLASIGIAQPLVHGQHPGKDFLVFDPVEQAFRKIIEDLALVRVANIAGAELQSGFAQGRATGAFHAQLGRVPNQPVANFNDLGGRNRKPYMLRQAGRQQFVRQDFYVLGIILELDYIEVPISRAHEMRLRAPAHAPDMLNSLNSHSEIFYRESNWRTEQQLANSNWPDEQNLLPQRTQTALFDPA